MSMVIDIASPSAAAVAAGQWHDAAGLWYGMDASNNAPAVKKGSTFTDEDDNLHTYLQSVYPLSEGRCIFFYSGGGSCYCRIGYVNGSSVSYGTALTLSASAYNISDILQSRLDPHVLYLLDGAGVMYKIEAPETGTAAPTETSLLTGINGSAQTNGSHRNNVAVDFLTDAEDALVIAAQNSSTLNMCCYSIGASSMTFQNRVQITSLAGSTTYQQAARKTADGEMTCGCTYRSSSQNYAAMAHISGDASGITLDDSAKDFNMVGGYGAGDYTHYNTVGNHFMPIAKNGCMSSHQVNSGYNEGQTFDMFLSSGTIYATSLLGRDTHQDIGSNDDGLFYIDRRYPELGIIGIESKYNFYVYNMVRPRYTAAFNSTLLDSTVRYFGWVFDHYASYQSAWFLYENAGNTKLLTYITPS